MPLRGRRDFLKAAASGAAASAALGSASQTIAQALALPAQNRSGSIQDVDHVVILMQENRSFDHYFGCLRGVRGFGDPRPVTLPGGAPVWAQPAPGAQGGRVLPFRLDARRTSAESLVSLDHSWKGSHALWKRHDAWIKVKTPMCMGYFQREDIPFYYALADAFTVCDAYHASLFGPTNPNRMYLFSGTCGVNVGMDGPMAVANPFTEQNETADQAHDGPKFQGFTWKTYAERLQEAGVSWKIYQEYDNYGNNGLAYFRSFRGLDPASPLYQKGRGWAAGSTAENAATSRGEHLVAAFTKDVVEGTLPHVSWVVAPTILCEHPRATPSYGEQLTAQLIKALACRPEVWSKSVFILNYDENDGYFDHVAPPVPPVAGAQGKSNVDSTGEIYNSVPIGLGPRVPMLIVSPWSKGGFVNSEVFDHTSVIRFLETRFKVLEPNITPWRRAVCGDLTSVFDFKTPNEAPPRLPPTEHGVQTADLASSLPRPSPPAAPAMPRQEPGRRPSRPLPYDLHATGVLNPDGFHLVFASRGGAAAVFQVYAGNVDAGPWYYTVAAGSTLRDVIPLPSGAFDVIAHGPNGFYRRWRAGGFNPAAPQTTLARDERQDRLLVTLFNPAATPVNVRVSNAYEGGKSHPTRLGSRETRQLIWPLKASDHWYDVAVVLDGDPSYLHQFCGHFETGAASRSDPLIGGQAHRFFL